jgi:hypothetical protein
MVGQYSRVYDVDIDVFARLVLVGICVSVCERVLVLELVLGADSVQTPSSVCPTMGSIHEGTRITKDAYWTAKFDIIPSSAMYATSLLDLNKLITSLLKTPETVEYKVSRALRLHTSEAMEERGIIVVSD